MSKMKSFKPYRMPDAPEDALDFWFFDDKHKGFDKEPFLLRFSELLTRMIDFHIKEDIENFHLLMSEEEFYGAQGSLVFSEKDHKYHFYDESANSALNPASVSIKNFVKKYFDGNPQKIYLRVEKQVKW